MIPFFLTNSVCFMTKNENGFWHSFFQLVSHNFRNNTKMVGIISTEMALTYSLQLDHQRITNLAQSVVVVRCYPSVLRSLALPQNLGIVRKSFCWFEE